MEYFKGFTPLVVESYRHCEYGKRRLRINLFNLHLVDEAFNLSPYKCKFISLEGVCLISLCRFLEIEYKDTPTYLYLNNKMCSFKKVPL